MDNTLQNKKSLSVLPVRELEISARELNDALSSWFKTAARVLPWRREVRDPYCTWISECMLQQTRVEAVLPYYARFIERFPDIDSLAAAEEDEIYKYWEGLGYYRRARHLLASARILKDQYESRFPQDYETLSSLPGLGPYSTAAILSLVYHLPHLAFDGNLKRVYSRVFAYGEDLSRKQAELALKNELAKLLEVSDPAVFNEGSMELGALLCLPKNPKCSLCPFSRFCRACAQGNPEDYPFRRPKKERRQRNFTLLLFCDTETGALLLEKRKETGLLASLYQFPHVEEALSLDELRDRLSTLSPWDQLDSWGEKKHLFSHEEHRFRAYFLGKAGLRRRSDSLFSLLRLNPSSCRFFAPGEWEEKAMPAYLFEWRERIFGERKKSLESSCENTPVSSL